MLWQSAGAFFPRDNSLVSARKSHSSGVRGLVVRCLLFNPEVSCFFTSFPKPKGSLFPLFCQHYVTTPLFGFVRLSKIFHCLQRAPPSIFATEWMFKNLKGSPLLQFSTLWDLLKLFSHAQHAISEFCFFFKKKRLAFFLCGFQICFHRSSPQVLLWTKHFATIKDSLGFLSYATYRRPSSKSFSKKSSNQTLNCPLLKQIVNFSFSNKMVVWLFLAQATPALTLAPPLLASPSRSAVLIQWCSQCFPLLCIPVPLRSIARSWFRNCRSCWT